MIITARQLEDLHKSLGDTGQVTLPYRARLTPLASDYVRARKLVLGYSEVSVGKIVESKLPAASQPVAQAAGPTGSFLWWCDGPSGPAKAAVMAEEKQSALRALDKPTDANQIVGVVKTLAAEVKAGRSAGGILLVQNGAQAGVYANRCPSLRAVVGSCLEAVEQGVRQIAANVLIIEYPRNTLQQMRNMISRFVRANRTLSEEVKRQIEELASCG